MNISVKLFRNWSIGQGGEAFKGFRFLAVAAILFNGAERF